MSETSENSENHMQKLRNYQAELFNTVKQQNSILFLPTGSGKTCIAIWLIKFLSPNLRKPISNGGKRTIFIVNTTELAYQQSKCIKDAGFKVSIICGNEGVDCWNKEQWEEQEKAEVIVLTCQCYLNALNHGFMLLENANLLIFDECHHAVSQHPMREVMKKFDILPYGVAAPHVLGLSATIVNKNIKNELLQNQLIELEKTFRAKVVTSTLSEVKNYSTNPSEVIKDFPKFILPNNIAVRIEELKKNSKHFADCFKLKEDEIVDCVMEQKPGSDFVLINVPGANRTKMLVNAIKDIEVHCKEFGMYFGLVCSELYIIQMYRYMFEVERTQFVDLILYFISVGLTIRKILHDEIIKVCSTISTETLIGASTRKLEYLFGVLKGIKSKDKCIIFVERKMTAKSLYVIVKFFARRNKLENIRVDFIVGTDCNPLRNTRELMHEKKLKDKILKSFRGDGLNVLIATNILEEGIDVPNCSLVIMFDELKTYRSYIQSKGRARMATSQYVVLNDVVRSKFEQRLQEFKDIERWLSHWVEVKGKRWDDDLSPEPTDSDEFYVTSINASIKEHNAVPLIYRYCQTLPHDLFTTLIPFWWLSDAGNDKICKLQLPVNSGIRHLIVGPPRSTAKSAKQAVAFQTVKMLHQSGSLDDRLLPMGLTTNLEDVRDWVPNWDDSTNKTKSDEPTIGQETYVSEFKLPSFLQNSRPVANTKCYLHVIDIQTEYEEPVVKRQKFCHALMISPYSFAILTRNELPELCRFPIYSDLGCVRVTVKCNVGVLVLNDRDLSDISTFHKFLFINVLRKVKSFFHYDAQSDANYFIVPVKQNSEHFDIVWKVVRKKIETNICRPSDEERENTKLTEDKFLGKVVTPWYRIDDPPTHYIVTDFETGKHLYTPMSDTEEKTFADHFENTYKLRALQPGQSMMEVRVITKLFDSIKPRPVSSSKKQKRRKNVDVQTYLPPEFVMTLPLPSIYWYKAILLPSILHRIHQLLLAEELRQKIVNETGVGSINLTIDENEEREYFVKEVNVPVTVETISNDRKLLIKERKIENKNNKSTDVLRDIYHNFEELKELTVKDVKNFVQYVEQPLHNENVKRANSSTVDLSGGMDGDHSYGKDYNIDFIEPPSLISLKTSVNPEGPNHYEILQALTLRGCNDTIDLERYETLGDSLLKYLVSFAIFVREQKMNEGLLTSLKSRIIGNKYLFDCAKKHNIPSYIQATSFTVDNRWIAPSFCIPPKLRALILNLKNSYSSLLKITLPRHIQFSGNLSPETIESIDEQLREFYKETEDIKVCDEVTSLFYLGKRKLSHKSIADVLEALIGVYLQTCGIQGAFNVMKYFGILSKEDYTSLMAYRSDRAVPPEHIQRAILLIPDYNKLEQLLNYEFRDKGLILQAITHPSCMTNSLTDCYQKLEFIGDAVLDFLITSYIYQYCGKLSPGEITDLRSALVNNNTFGALAVRLGLQKYLLAHSKSLEDAVSSFVSYQTGNNFRIYGNELMVLVNENDTIIAEEVDVPKALGDVFESIAGAIFVDSDYDLNVVWKIYFNIMADEIVKFSSKVPINPIRALFEMNMKVKFETNDPKNVENENKGLDKFRVRLCVHTKKEPLLFTGRGCNTSSAKRAAAKLALKHFGYSEFVI